jgi:ATP-dependent RNA helicase RhlE
METTIEFNEFTLNTKLLTILDNAGFKNASPIQELVIQPILDGKDIFAQAETGSGKTGAFAIPIIEQILRKYPDNLAEIKKTLYVVLSPTRELAQQTYKVFQQFGNELGVSSCCVIGGEDIEKQKITIAKGSHVLVATPGRLKDLIKQKVVVLESCNGVVFDEADRLFDMGFKKDIEFILSRINTDRQLIMVSATTNLDVLNTAHKYKSHPIELKVNADTLLVDNISHEIAMVTRDEKFPLLISLLRKQEDTYAIVFCNTQIMTHTVAEWLILMGFKAKAISGKLPQNTRTRLMKEFREKEIIILVCTDVAARGLDIEGVNFVVNYDLPQEAASYVHRIGRTGRAGKSGQAISLCAHEDCEYLDPIYKFIKQKINKMQLTDENFATDICKKPYIDHKTLKVVDRDQRYNKSNRDDNKKSSDNRGSSKSYKDKEPRRKKTTRPTDEVGYQGPKIDRRNFIISSNNENEAKQLAIKHFDQKDDYLLSSEILEKGAKKFFFFGAQSIKYKFYLKPIYKRLLTPYIINILKMMKINAEVRVSFKDPHLRINFSGKDEKLLLNNNSELLESLEHLIRKYLSQKIEIQHGLKYSVKCYNNSKKNEKGLLNLVDKIKKQVIDSGKSSNLKPMNPADRRIVHQHLDKDPDVKTSSIGDGRFKQIEISLR